MLGACLVPLMTLALAVAPDAASLVARLGSGTFTQREEASRQLEAMGREALPALEVAMRSPDAEARSRVLAAWDRIQKGLLVRPTMVQLKAGDRPVSEVARSIGQQAGVSIEISQQAPEQSINAREPMPIPFWDAVERLGLGRGFVRDSGPAGSQAPILQFGGFEPAYPATISGPFRITLEGLHEHRDRLLILGPWVNGDGASQGIPIPRTAPERQARFYVDLGMAIEPRVWFTQEGPVRVIEAVDNLGQSLLRRVAGQVEADYSMLHNGGGVSQGRTQLDLAMPERPGRSIARLRAAIPVAIQMRRPLPELEIALPTPDGKRFAHEDADFTIRQFREDAQGTHITVDVRLNLNRCELPADRPGPLISSRLSCLVDRQIELVDADGRVVAVAPSGYTRPDGYGRRNYTAWKNMNQARPTRLRYYRVVRAFTDVAFEFRDIPMP